DVGQAKVDALARHLGAIQPDVTVDARRLDLRDIDDDTLVDWIAESDLVVGATDHMPSQGRIASLTYHRVPAVFPAVYERGSGGEVIWTAPGLDMPCRHCVLDSVED